MTKREVITAVLNHHKPPYIPWSFGFTQEAMAKLTAHYADRDINEVLQNHFLNIGNGIGFFTELENDRFLDVFDVIWNREVDKDIGIVEKQPLSGPTLTGYNFPDPEAPQFFEDIQAEIEKAPDKFRVFNIGFSLYERAWTMRGMENLLMDFIENPDFVHKLFGSIADYNITQLKKACTFDIDAISFGDDWGQQHGLIMGPAFWYEFIYPQLKRMYAAVHAEGKKVFIHSCGDVDELFDDLISIGLNCFNPFQPEVMDVRSLMERYRGKLTFHGGLSTQQTLPFGSVEDVREECRNLMTWGTAGNYILSPAHAVEGDVPVENMVAFIEAVQNQPGWVK